jgi:hypothetical protein
MLVEIATAIGQRAATSATQLLLRDLLGVQDQQLQALEAIRQDVTTLLEVPWRRAKLLLVEAADAVDEKDRQRYLGSAEEALFEAVSFEPSATPRRATVAADLALVLGMRGNKQASVRWARTAHDDQVMAVEAAVPSVLKTVNSRLRVLGVGDFWRYVASERRDDPWVAQIWLKERYERGTDMTEIWREEAGHTWRAHGQGAPADYVAMASYIRIAEQMTEGGRKLIELHQMNRDVREYRGVCLALDPPRGCRSTR